MKGIYHGNGSYNTNNGAIKSAMKILNLGCGNSIMPEDMHDEGYRLIWNMDIS